MAATMDNSFKRCPIIINDSSHSRIYTPLDLKHWQEHLAPYPNQEFELVHFFLEGIAHGFRIGFNGSAKSLRSARRNLQGAISHPKVVNKYLKDKLILNGVYGCIMGLTQDTNSPQCRLAGLELSLSITSRTSGVLS